MVTKASMISANLALGVICTAISAMAGAAKVSSSVPMVPAMNEPMAAVASAAAARPLRAILLPSSAVMMLADSPGVFSRMEVVLPPNIPP